MFPDDELPIAPVAPTKIGADAPDFAQQAAEADALIGARLGNLELVQRIGVGGMGTVYKALHTTLRAPYAVKVLHTRFSEDETVVERFRLEAVACSRLRQENVVFVTDFGFADGLGLYITMEYLEGASLGRILRKFGAMPIGRMGRIGEQVCTALAAAHRLDIVHRDVKPDNIQVLSEPGRRDFTKVLDFGIAKIRAADGRDLTNSGSAVGTPRYMPPEQLMERKTVGPAADIYALGCVFYAMLTGAPPFVEGSDFEILTQHVTDTPTPPSEAVPVLRNSLLEELVLHMLQKEPGRRPESMDIVRERLLAAVQQLADAGVAGADYIADPGEALKITGSFEVLPASLHSVRMSTVIQRIRDVDPLSPAAVLLAALPSVGALQGEVLCLALWGILQQEILDAELDSPAFERSAEQILLLLQAVLESHPGPRPSTTQQKVFRSLRNLLALLPKDRLRPLVHSLRPLEQHLMFPPQILPPDELGSWGAMKAVLTTEINLPGFRARTRNTGKVRTLSARSGSARALESGDAGDNGADAASSRRPDAPDSSLVDKLKADVSMRSIKSVLTHRITLTGTTGELVSEDELPSEDELED